MSQPAMSPPPKDCSSLAIELTKASSRDALMEQLTKALSSLQADEVVALIADVLVTMNADREALKERVTELLVARFGRRSEKVTSEQMALFAKTLAILTPEPDEVSCDEEEAAPEPSHVVAERLIAQTNADIEADVQAQREAKARAREERKEAAKSQATKSAPSWPPNLPVREETLAVPQADATCDDRDCGKERGIIGYETSWRLERTTTTEVVVSKIPIVACPDHHGGPKSASVPPKPVDKGRIGFSLAADILYWRIVHNLPVARIVEMLAVEGAPVSESMIHTLIATSGERCKPVVEAIASKVRDADLVNIDDTPTAVHEGHRNRKRTTARVWLALGDERFAYFFSTKSWKTADAVAHLGSIRGVLQGDGYKGFKRYASERDVVLAGCMDHLRRKLKRALDAHDPRAVRAFTLVQGLYRVEDLARRRHLSDDDRLLLRQERSQPIFDALIDWAHEVQPTIETGSPLGKAWTYLSNQLEPLQAFLNDGVISISNAAAERGLRRITIGRKLWLFFRDHDKLQHVARLMSVMYTARLHGTNERTYLAWLLEQLARREWSSHAAVQLLPAAFEAAHEEAE